MDERFKLLKVLVEGNASEHNLGQDIAAGAGTVLMRAGAAEKAAGRASVRIKMPTLHERTVEVLREMIVEGELAPGTRLQELELCDELGVSRTPLREAIKVLAHEGLVRLEANRGATVTTPEMPEVADTLEMMGLLEGAAAMLCAHRASDAELAAILKAHEDLICHSGNEELQEYFRANIRFHDLIMKAAGNYVLCDMHVKLGSQLKRVRASRVDKSSLDEREAFIDEHQSIVDALLRRDGMGAFQAALIHMASIAQARDSQPSK
ncbi:transcriptional regulator, GntR family [Novosphingobium sp. Rr 2-17]|uniref:GntR family transcriptional regulator n=1 Tax=Novosphingobium sp. Rr 2-17 TaxID=555793 RepID=UPI0002698583|nr:GntR family transcriptional regulator [Novosphingobium sp. Rr 2-17]EIZ77743.1 transcriptional regulator, GntR family [Novosphingobium sp. Rr 2-17]